MKEKNESMESKWNKIKNLLRRDETGLPEAAELNLLISDFEEEKRNAPELCSTRRNSVFKRLDSK